MFNIFEDWYWLFKDYDSRPIGRSGGLRAMTQTLPLQGEPL